MKDCTLKNKVALVTGGRRGIGRAVALAFARRGADVAVSDAVVDDGMLEETAKEIRAFGSRSLSLRADVSLRSDVETMTQLALQEFGKIDILTNCAGVWIPGETLIECSDENWDKVMDTNLKGTYLCCQAVGRSMIVRRHGCILNMSSQVGLTPGIAVGAYSISKAGIIMLTRQLALELAPFNIRVNALAPGIVKTDFNAAFWKEPEAERRSSAMVPLGRLAVPEDIAEAALFLASAGSGYVTGEVLRINGGWAPPVVSG
ncbi:MAG: glucose 1-dehydrogenase [Rubrivivax sp.]|nr:glucose 1-dehydrogenase [Rubrivivax sp.]